MSFAIMVVTGVVVGKFDERPLRTLNGKTTCPTTGKVKNATFNTVGSSFDGGYILDLSFGSGSLVIEAISHGMDEAALVERNRQAQATILESIKMIKSEQQFHLLKVDANKAIGAVDEQFDLVLLDPPHAKEETVKNITELEEAGLLSEDVMLAYETGKAIDLPEEISNFGIWRQKTYGISEVTVYAR